MNKRLSKRRGRVNFDKAKAELSEKIVSFLETEPLEPSRKLRKKFLNKNEF